MTDGDVPTNRDGLPGESGLETVVRPDDRFSALCKTADCLRICSHDMSATKDAVCQRNHQWQYCTGSNWYHGADGGGHGY
jgi:hypothetical protein